MSGLRLIPTVAAFAAAAVSLQQVHAAERPPAPWWNKEWRFRKIVRITFPEQGGDLPVDFFAPSKLLGARSLTGKTIVEIDGQKRPRSEETVVTDAKGAVLPARAYASGWDNKVTVLFRAKPKTADYYIYYGNPKANIRPENWRRDPYPLLMVTVPVPGASIIKDPAGAARALMKGKPVSNPMGTYSVDTQANPFGLQRGGHYVTLYSGLAYAPAAGTYEFGLDAGGTAHLLIDGSLILTVSGRSAPAGGGTWDKKANAKLEHGVHRFTILHGESAGAQGVRVGWRRPGDRRVFLMTGSSFARSNYTPAELIGFEELGKAATPFFTVKRSDVAYKITGGKAMVSLKLINRTRGRGLSYRWKVGERSFTGRSPRCFVEASGQCPVALEVFESSRSLGTYARTVRLGTIPHIEVEARSELLTCPDILYENEPAKVTFGIANLSEHSVPLRYEWVTPVDEIVVPAAGKTQVDVELSTPTAAHPSVEGTLRLWLAGDKVGEATVRIVRRNGHFSGALTHLAHRTGKAGTQIIITSKPEDLAYDRERARITFELSNPAGSPVKLRCEALMSRDSGVVEVPAEEEAPIEAALPTPLTDGSLSEATLRVWRAETKMAEATVRIVRRGRELSGSLTKLAHRIEGRTARVVIVARPEDIICRGERAKLTFKLSNRSVDTAKLRYEWVIPATRTVSGTVEAPARSEEPVDVELPVPAAGKSFARGTFSLWLTDVLLSARTIRTARTGRHLAHVTTKLGRLVDKAGRRLTLITKPENEVDHRRWAPLKWAAKRFASKPKKIMLFGDPMVNVPEESGGTGYVDLLKSRLEEADRTLTFVESNRHAIVPCLAGIPAFGAALAKHKPELVLVSPGNADALKGVARLRFARSLDVLIDIARAQPNPPAMVIVTPPPLVSNPKRSARLAAAAAIIAKQHHIRYVDLHSLVTAKNDWKDSYKQDRDDLVYYLYPNAATHKELAEAILTAIQ